MLSREDNERLTRVGRDTPMGNVFRRYWLPILLSSELKPDAAPVRVELLGEKLVAFRDSNGVPGLVDAFCAHRRAPMFFGRKSQKTAPIGRKSQSNPILSGKARGLCGPIWDRRIDSRPFLNTN